MWQKFSNTFIPLSDLISIKGRSELSPVVGFSSSTGQVWKLDSNNLKFRRNHVLPFSEDQNRPQSKLLKAVVSQPCSKDMVLMMLSLSRQVGVSNCVFLSIFTAACLPGCLSVFCFISFCSFCLIFSTYL
jgi:hypothetical protein